MSLDSSLAEFQIDSGAQRGSHLSLYANRLVHQGGDSIETVPLAQLAAVRVAFERDPHKLNWAIVLLVIALILMTVSGPLQGWIVGAVAKVGDPVRRDSFDAVLLGLLHALGGFASILPGIAVALVVAAVALLSFFWLGVTTLTLSVAAVERAYAVRGRSQPLFEFSEALAGQLAARKG